MSNLLTIEEAINMRDWQEQVKALFKEELGRKNDHGEIPYAKQLSNNLNSCNGHIVYCQGKFWVYNENIGCYEILMEVELRKLLYDIHNAKGHDGTKHSLTPSKVRNILKVSSDFLTDNNFFSNAIIGFATEGSYLHLNSEGKIEIRGYCYTNRALAYIPIEYDPYLDASSVLKTIADIIGDEECALSYFEILGVALFGLGAKYGTMAVFKGFGANGKSALVSLMQKLIPRNLHSSVPLADFKIDFLRSSLNGKHLNTCDEFPPLNNAALQYVKNIITGDPIAAREVRGNSYTMFPIAQHIVCTNHLPYLSENNEAIDRRIIVIPFNKTIPRAERDVNFATSFFQAYAKELLILACQGAERAVQRGSIFEPEISRREKNLWLRRADCIGAFIDERIEHTGNPQDRIRSPELFEACVSFANANGFPPPSAQRSFSEEFEAKGFQKQKSSGVMMWLCIKLKAT